MAKKSKAKLPGCVYKKRGRYYWKVKLPGEAEVKARPLVPTGGRYATKDKGVAVEVAVPAASSDSFPSAASTLAPVSPVNSPYISLSSRGGCPAKRAA